ncbi:hypothetical protein Dimus_024144 [Dionaea muscipula]
MNLLRNLGVAGLTVPRTTLLGQRPRRSSSLRLRLPIPFTYSITNTQCSLPVSTHVASRARNPHSQSESSVPIDDDAVWVEDEVDERVLYDVDDLEDVEDDEDQFEDEVVTEDAEVYVGDGAAGGGISLVGTWWDKEALAIAEEVCQSFDDDIRIYAFRTLVDATIQVRIEKLSPKSSSLCMSDIEAFSVAYRARLDESIPENISLEVSSPGVERVVRIPEDLDRFKDRPMYVKYVSEVAATGTSTENDGIFRLVSFDLETKFCTWGLADVRVNREKSGKGRPMSKKQREWRLSTPFDCLRIVRLHFEI